MNARRLGPTDIEISPIGLGCLQFAGSGRLASLGARPIDQPTVDAVVGAALDAGVTWFDTAEGYGRGHSERALTSALTARGVPPGGATIATKWTPTGRTAGHLRRSIGDRLDHLQGHPVDLYQIHEPYSSLSSVPAQLRAMAALHHAGAVRAVGVSNFNARRMTTAYETLRAEGVPLASNQVQINLLHRGIEHSGVLDTARRLGVTLIAYSPLAGGILTGRYHDDPAQVATVPKGRRWTGRGAYGTAGLARTRPLIDALRTVAEAHDATVAQVALAWLVTYYGDTVVAIPGASRPAQATELAGAMRVTLTDAEVGRIDAISRRLA
ncbi:aldo/keto reductase [Actinocatenispora rupis]|uniref:Oxidoreductase n=1 Tax=Actinocatenispora rupis TaxID=519421 RepID=A0A8J3JC34_9ACTN|nr:aldo/keto reductase [Actinocatenispora rupis]GID14019.1 oxidoreductase [Actinocatenispora rupis]